MARAVLAVQGLQFWCLFWKCPEMEKAGEIATLSLSVTHNFVFCSFFLIFYFYTLCSPNLFMFFVFKVQKGMWIHTCIYCEHPWLLHGKGSLHGRFPQCWTVPSVVLVGLVFTGPLRLEVIAHDLKYTWLNILSCVLCGNPGGHRGDILTTTGALISTDQRSDPLFLPRQLIISLLTKKFSQC